jgi:hypothetical protein
MADTEAPTLAPGSNEPVAQPPLSWLTPGLTRFLLLVMALGCVTALCFTGRIAGPQALAVYTTVVGAVLLGSGTKQGADAAASSNGK